MSIYMLVTYVTIVIVEWAEHCECYLTCARSDGGGGDGSDGEEAVLEELQWRLSERGVESVATSALWSTGDILWCLESVATSALWSTGDILTDEILTINFQTCSFSRLDI